MMTATKTIRCGNRAAHKGFPAHHETVAQVRLCFARGAVASIEEAAAVAAEVARVEAEEAECEHGLSAWLCDDPVTHYSDRDGGLATESNAHAEWHRNAGVPMGQPGCPQDACHLPDPPEDEAVEDTPTRLYDGIYTVETDEGHRTFRVRTQGPDEDFAPGKVVIAYLSGPDNSRDYTGFGFVLHGPLTSRVAIWGRFKGNAELVRDAEVLAANPEGALKMAHCSRCHRKLTVPTSVYAGVGPECAKKGL